MDIIRGIGNLSANLWHNVDIESMSYLMSIVNGGNKLKKIRWITPVMAVIMVSSFFTFQSAALSATNNTLPNGGAFQEGQGISSADGGSKAVLQFDGNFVIYKNNKAIWADGVNNAYGSNFIVVQGDGNVVDYLWNGHPFWASGTNGPSAIGAFLLIQNDGNLVLYNKYSQPLWSTITGRLATPVLPTPPPTTVPPTTTTTVPVTTAPTSAVTYPTNASTLGTDYTGTLTGTASAKSPYTVSSVSLTIKDTTNNTYWNGTAWNSTATNTVPATGTTSWRYALAGTNLLIHHGYSITAKITDSANNTASSTASTFTCGSRCGGH